jgi:hypothetical protein
VYSSAAQRGGWTTRRSAGQGRLKRAADASVQAVLGCVVGTQTQKQLQLGSSVKHSVPIRPHDHMYLIIVVSPKRYVLLARPSLCRPHALHACTSKPCSKRSVPPPPHTHTPSVRDTAALADALRSTQQATSPQALPAHPLRAGLGERLLSRRLPRGGEAPLAGARSSAGERGAGLRRRTGLPLRRRTGLTLRLRRLRTGERSSRRLRQQHGGSTPHARAPPSQPSTNHHHHRGRRRQQQRSSIGRGARAATHAHLSRGLSGGEARRRGGERLRRGL